MTPEEKKQLDTIEEDMSKVLTEIRGSAYGNKGGILGRLEFIEHELLKIRNELAETTGKQRKIYTIILYIGVGILVGGVLFGIVSIKDLIEIIKSIK